MMREGDHLESLIAEYIELFRQKREAESIAALDKHALLVTALSKHSEWTQEGANEIVHLATGYGAFMLRNALAVAVALAKEDGELGF